MLCYIDDHRVEQSSVVVLPLDLYKFNLIISSGVLENFETNETFIGYHQDTTASYVKTEWKKIQMMRNENRPLDQVPQFRGPLLNECKMKLLRTVSYDGLVRFSLSDNVDFAVSLL